MTAFTVGMIAAILWVGVVIALWLVRRNSPGPPFRSIGRFRVARRRLAPLSAVPETVPEPRQEDAEESSWSSEPVSEVAAEALVAASSDALPTGADPPAKERKRGPRRTGRFTYFVVDEMGRPEL